MKNANRSAAIVDADAPVAATATAADPDACLPASPRLGCGWRMMMMEIPDAIEGGVAEGINRDCL